MDFFFENFWKFIIGGALVEIGLAIAIAKTGRGIWLTWMAAVAVVTGGLVLVERLVVTEREKVEITLYDAAATVEKNDVNALLEFVSPSANQIRANLRSRLPRYQIDKVSIKNDLKITVNESTSPASAHAEFRVVVTGGERASGFHEISIPVSFVVAFERENGRWLISGYEEHTGLGIK